MTDITFHVPEDQVIVGAPVISNIHYTSHDSLTTQISQLIPNITIPDAATGEFHLRTLTPIPQGQRLVCIKSV